MIQHIEVVYENGVFRPLQPMPSPPPEGQQLMIVLMDATLPPSWLADADTSVTLEQVRAGMSTMSVNWSEFVRAERDERFVLGEQDER